MQHDTTRFDSWVLVDKTSRRTGKSKSKSNSGAITWVSSYSRELPQWIATVGFDERGDAFDFSIRPNEEYEAQDRAPLTARSIRQFPFGQCVDFALSCITKADDGQDETSVLLIEVKRPGRRGTPLEEYAQLAAYYVAGLGEGKKAALIADELGISSRQLSNQLQAAKQRGLLTKPGRGRSNVVLTEKAQQLLRQG